MLIDPVLLISIPMEKMDFDSLLAGNANKAAATNAMKLAKAAPNLTAPPAAAQRRPAQSSAATTGYQFPKHSSQPAQPAPQDIQIGMAQLLCTVARQQAALASAMIQVVVYVAASAPAVLTSVKEKTQAYSQQGKTLSSVERGLRPPPHVFVWNTLIMQMAEVAKAAGSSLVQTALQAHMADIEKLANQMCKDQKLDPAVHLMAQKAAQVQLQVKMCKVSECFKSINHKIEMIVMPGTTAAALAKELIAFCVQSLGGTQKPSVAPKGRLERMLGDWVAAQTAEQEE